MAMTYLPQKHDKRRSKLVHLFPTANSYMKTNIRKYHNNQTSKFVNGA